ncbi:aminotransferase class V-fold PLP-dependent enzyme [Poriferisphaera sp. WC338]|uniref:aminotransferase class V-fold PLP-dependent enzyme n=1 Tax=Poriferisphaera sp. WC338 TaxID=3425129 RepID=UPI003D817D96
MTQDQKRMNELFPILDEMIFLNHAAVAPVSGPSADEMIWFAQHSAKASYVKSGCYRKCEAVKEKAAKLISASGGHEIAFVPNTTTGLAMVANGLLLGEGDSVVITNVEYPANRYPWENLAKTKGVKLIEVQQRDDARIHVEDVANAIEDGTKVVALSHVQFASGHRIDLKAVSDAAHAKGAYLCVDGIQSVGVLPVDVQAMGIDFLSADSHKWMLGPEGCGIFYCREDLVEQLYPTVVGWMNMVDADNYGNYQFELQKDARRFEPGSWNVIGVLGMGASIDLLLEVGVDKIWQQVEKLTTQAHAGIETKRYRVVSPREVEGERSGIVIFEHPDKPEKHASIVGKLSEQGIVIALREGRLRVSPHFYNTAEQIEKFVEALPQA